MCRVSNQVLSSEDHISCHRSRRVDSGVYGICRMIRCIIMTRYMQSALKMWSLSSTLLACKSIWTGTADYSVKNFEIYQHLLQGYKHRIKWSKIKVVWSDELIAIQKRSNNNHLIYAPHSWTLHVYHVLNPNKSASFIARPSQKSSSLSEQGSCQMADSGEN